MGVNKVVFGAVSIMDISDSEVTPNTLCVGGVAYGADGEKVIGENPYEKESTDTEVSEQGSLIQQIKTALAEKAAGVQLPDIAEEDLGTASDLAEGKKLIDKDGNIVEGTLHITGDEHWEYDEISVGDGYIAPFFYLGNDVILRQGNVYMDVALDEFGEAVPGDVRAGKYFTSKEGFHIPGTMEESSGGVTLPEGAVVVQKVLAAQASQQIGSGYSLSITYGDNVEINDSIALAFTGTTKNLSNISATTDFSVLSGKYVRTGSSYGTTTGTFYYIPDGATFTVGGQSMNKTLTCDKSQKVSMEKVSV